jgi:hypothetical protein
MYICAASRQPHPMNHHPFHHHDIEPNLLSGLHRLPRLPRATDPDSDWPHPNPKMADTRVAMAR